MSNVTFYRCGVCGNLVALVNEGGGTLVCCGKAMTKLEPNSTDASQEKHVPVVTEEGGKMIVSVGSVPHPMAPEHFIEWIALDTDAKTEIVRLQPGAEPKAEFPAAEKGTVYAYCNLHGLWKTDF